MGRWQWANKKTKQQSSFIAKKRPNSKCIEQDIKYCHWAMFKYAMEFFKQLVSFKKPLPKHYFTNFLKIYQTKTWSWAMWIISNRNCRTPNKTICNSKKANMGPTTWKIFLLQPHVNRKMIGSPPKPQEVWDSKKRQHSNPWGWKR